MRRSFRFRHRMLALITATVLAALVVVVGAGAGSAVAQESSPSPSASPSPTGPAAVAVGNADNGRTVLLVPGQELDVELVPPSPGEQWQGPVTTGPLYLVEYSESSERTRTTLQALASSAEPVVLRARTDRACFHSGEPCVQAFSEWSLQVVVDEGPAPEPAYQCLTMPMPSSAPGTVPVTEQDNGKRFTVQEGHIVSVQLRGCNDQFAVPTSSGPLFRAWAAQRANGVNWTSFRALRTGTTKIESFTDTPCFHMSPACARPSSLWSVDIEVVPATQDNCNVAPTLTLDRPTVTATAESQVTVRGSSDSIVDLFAYTRPSTTYRLVRSGVLGGDGTLAFAVRPPANTRLYAQQRGCAPGESVVLNVATALTLTAERTGPREYVFAGDSLPARSGGLIVSVYRLTSEGREVLTAQTRAAALDGEWRLLRRFTGTGRFGFLVRTGQDLQNAPGASNVRSLLVH